MFRHILKPGCEHIIQQKTKNALGVFLFFFLLFFLYLKALSIDACPRTITAKIVPIPGQNPRGSVNTDPWHTAAGQ